MQQHQVCSPEKEATFSSDKSWRDGKDLICLHFNIVFCSYIGFKTDSFRRQFGEEAGITVARLV